MEIKLNKKIYPLDAILHTCNLYSDQIYFKIDKNAAEFKVSTSLKQGTNNNKLKKLMDEFQNELLYQTLRLNIAKENKKARELIIEQALCAALPSQQDEQIEGQSDIGDIDKELEESEIDKELEEILKEVEAEDYQDDPLGIALPWEETQKKTSLQKTPKKQKGKTKTKMKKK